MFLLICDTRPNKWSTQWDSNPLLLTITLPEVTISMIKYFYVLNIHSVIVFFPSSLSFFTPGLNVTDIYFKSVCICLWLWLYDWNLFLFDKTNERHFNQKWIWYTNSIYIYIYICGVCVCVYVCICVYVCVCVHACVLYTCRFLCI